VLPLVRSARLAHARLHDTLTGLLNRALFLERVQQAINEQRPDEPVAALFIDLDGFKPINDTYGHAAGDALLKAVSDRLIESMRPGDYVCRFGGDEFLVLCQRLREPEDAQHVLDNTTGIVGFFGASSMERLPTEIAMTENMRRFKSVEIGRTA